MASAAAMSSPSAQPCTVLPTALQKLDWVSWSPSVDRVLEIGGKWRLGSAPIRGRSSNRASTPSTLSQGSAQSGTRGLATALMLRLGLEDQVVEVRLLLQEAVLLGELRLLLDRRPADVLGPLRQVHLLRRGGRDLGVGQHDLAHLIGVALRVGERLVHRRHETLHRVLVLGEVLLGGEVARHRELGRRLLVGVEDRSVALRLAERHERLNLPGGVDAAGVERAESVRERDLGVLDLVVVRALCLGRRVDRQRAHVLERVDGYGLALEVLAALDRAAL